MAQQQIIPLAA
uniref:Uncharacterized protein n=1 Tax=Arundo donax TaxID=35708 RepID=A0A0A8ZLY0_ARUDO